MIHRAMRTRLRRGAALTAVAAGAAAAIVGAASEARAGTVNTARGQLVVWNDNVENLLPASCGSGDFGRLVRHLRAQATSPDVFTVQQVSDAGQLRQLTARLSAELPGTYGGVIAVADPGSMGYTSRCGKLKNEQTNAVVYRTDRFTYEAATRWRSDAPDNWRKGTGPCRNLDDTPTSQDRVVNVAVRLHDRVAGKDVTVASVHWPTGTWHGPECADENMREAADAVGRLGGSLRIVAGDMNTTKGTRGWWNDARALGFRDPVAETCPARGCPDSTSTFGHRRIDFLLVKGSHGFTGARTVTERITGGAYSEHRAVTSVVKY